MKARAALVSLGIVVTGCGTPLKQLPLPKTFEEASSKCYMFLLTSMPRATSLLKGEHQRDYYVKITGFTDHDGEPGLWGEEQTTHRLVEMKPGRYQLLFEGSFRAIDWYADPKANLEVHCREGDIAYVKMDLIHSGRVVSLNVSGLRVADEIKRDVLDVAINGRSIWPEKFNLYVKTGGKAPKDYIAPSPKPAEKK